MQVKATMKYLLTPITMTAVRRQVLARVEQRENPALWWECKSVQPLWETVWRFIEKLKIEIPHDPVILLLGVSLKKTKSPVCKDICTPGFIAALFTAAKTQKQPKCPLIGERVKEMWRMPTVGYCSSIKKKACR